MAKIPTANPEAYELYLKGRYFLEQAHRRGSAKSDRLLQSSDRKRPGLCAGLCGGSPVLAFPAGLWRRSSPGLFSAGRGRDSKALSLDDSSSEAHAARGMMLAGYQFDYPAGKKEYERAMQLNPNDATAHHWFASDVLGALGESGREIAEMKRARDLDPLSSSSTPIWESLGARGSTRRSDRPIAQDGGSGRQVRVCSADPRDCP